MTERRRDNRAEAEGDEVLELWTEVPSSFLRPLYSDSANEKRIYAAERKEEEEEGRGSSDVSGKSFGLFATGELHRRIAPACRQSRGSEWKRTLSPSPSSLRSRHEWMKCLACRNHYRTVDSRYAGSALFNEISLGSLDLTF